MISTESELRPRILIVDNDIDSRETLADVLDVVGYRTLCANDGKEALERLEDGLAPFLIVLEPGPSSSVLEPFWQDRRLCAAPLVIVTSQEEGECVSARFPDTAVRFRKPLDVPALLSTIASFRSRHYRRAKAGYWV